MIYFENVNKEYRGHKILDSINITIEKGELVSIVGHSGAGKTSLIKLMLAEEKPTKGKVSFYSESIHDMKGRLLNDYRRKIGVVFQDFRLLPNRTAYENIAFAMEAAGKTDHEIKLDVPHVLDLVDLKSRMNSFPHELSGGEKQRVAIARAIVNKPSIIIADECTGNLDRENSIGILNILKEINKEGVTVIMATHDNEIIKLFPKRVIQLENGKIVKDTKREMYEDII